MSDTDKQERPASVDELEREIRERVHALAFDNRGLRNEVERQEAKVAQLEAERAAAEEGFKRNLRLGTEQVRAERDEARAEVEQWKAEASRWETVFEERTIKDHREVEQLRAALREHESGYDRAIWRTCPICGRALTTQEEAGA